MANADFDLNERMLWHAMALAREAEARAVLISADAFDDLEPVTALASENDVQLVVVTSNTGTQESLTDAGAEVIKVPEVRLTRMGQVKLAILHGVVRQALDKGDTVVAITGVAGSRRVDTIAVAMVGGDLEMLSAEHDVLPEDVEPDVFLRVVDIAVALGTEGREGIPLGATFVVGDADAIGEHSHQMVLNPFQGHAEEDRNILDPRLEETVKEYAALDGAFVIRGDGLLVTTGAFLLTKSAQAKLPSGLGTRHHSAAAITGTTESVAVTVSASTGNVTVFRRSRPIIEIERPRAAGGPPRGSRNE